MNPTEIVKYKEMYKLNFSHLSAIGVGVMLLILPHKETFAQTTATQTCTNYWINPNTGTQECLDSHLSITRTYSNSSSNNGNQSTYRRSSFHTYQPSAYVSGTHYSRFYGTHYSGSSGTHYSGSSGTHYSVGGGRRTR